MRRIYAFEAEGVSDEVKAQLEKVEDVVDSKCDSAEDCDKILDKIDTQKEKFDDALKTMAGAAKDCKDGKCDAGEMASKIAPKMAELKEVAKEIGVATESDAVTEEELKDVKEYLEGAEEIVEAKKDELDGGGSSDDDKETDEATEAYLNDIEEDAYEAMEAALLDDVLYSNAMEGDNLDALAIFRGARNRIKTARAEMKKADKAGNSTQAAAKARECATHTEEAIKAIDNLPSSLSSKIIANIAIGVLAMAVAALAVATITGNVGEAAAKRGIGSGRAGSKAAKATIASLRDNGTEVDKEWAKSIRETGKSSAKSDLMANSGAAGETAAKAGAVAGATGVGGLAIMSVFKKTKALDADGNPDPARVNENSGNMLLVAIKADLRRIKKAYEKKATTYGRRSTGSDNASAPAAESFTDFIAACESMQFNSGPRRRYYNSELPFLFD